MEKCCLAEDSTSVFDTNGNTETSNYLLVMCQHLETSVLLQAENKTLS